MTVRRRRGSGVVGTWLGEVVGEVQAEAECGKQALEQALALEYLQNY